MNALLNFLFDSVLVILLCWLYWKAGHASALKDQDKFGTECYQRGRNDEAKWWIDTEAAVKATRQQMAKKEPQP